MTEQTTDSEQEQRAGIEKVIAKPEWETITLDQVRAGDDIRFNRYGTGYEITVGKNWKEDNSNWRHLLSNGNHHFHLIGSKEVERRIQPEKSLQRMMDESGLVSFTPSQLDQWADKAVKDATEASSYDERMGGARRVELSKGTLYCSGCEALAGAVYVIGFSADGSPQTCCEDCFRSENYESHKEPDKSEIEESVISKIRTRRNIGREKYGTTMEREDLTAEEWLMHHQEELMDAAIYVEKQMRVMGEVRELVKKWRQEADEMPEGAALRIYGCSDELEAVIGEVKSK